jgi:hypothetical protein
MDDGEEDQIFDRCPADLLAYLIAHPDSDGDVRVWLPRVRNVMRRLDLIVFVPVEEPDRIIVSDAEESNLRQRVDEELREIVIKDRWDFGVGTIEVAGSSRERVRQVLAHIAR